MEKEQFEAFMAENSGRRRAETGIAAATDRGPTKWDQVVKALCTHYHDPDIAAARTLYAAVAAHDLNGQPVWPMAIAPPSTMKTELIRALDGMDRVHSVDSVTSKTFISGQIRDREVSANEQPSSLLHRIGSSGVLLCPDFSTILAIKADDRNAIFADLRRIYDGELRKEFGTSETVKPWKGRLTLIAGVTPEIDKHFRAVQALGERFVMIRWKRAGEEAALLAMTQDTDTARRDLRSAVHDLLTDLRQYEPSVERSTLKRLAALAEFAVRARSHVSREESDKSIVGEPEPESAPRLAQQLCQLAKGSARLAAREGVNEEDFSVAKRAAFDCIPARRRTMLEWVMNDGKVSIKGSTQSYDRRDLESLGLLDDDRLSDLAKRLLATINGDFTRSPPNTNEEISRWVTGRFSELMGNDRETSD